MVDFRYHLVSLVSVFIALAVGIILGAGPLQNTIGNALSGQVETLRESRDEARDALDAAQETLENENAALSAAGTQLVEGTLTGRNVGLIVLPGVDGETVSGLEDRLESAGATISGELTLTENFASSSQSTYRQALASQLADYADSLPDNAGTNETIAVFVDMYLRKGTSDGNVQVFADSLTADDKTQLVDVTREVTAPADAIVIVTPATVQPSGTTASASADAAEITAQNGVYTALFTTSAGRGPTVAVGSMAQDDDALVGMRQADVGSTVDSVGTVSASINTSLAVAAEIAGTHVSLGSQEGADAVLGTRVDAAASTQSTSEPSANPSDNPSEDQ
ncbi:MAG: copper transporter [Actinomycetaceae bacterium]|nr:copper transporter [Actinomycetaceae bacterium]